MLTPFQAVVWAAFFNFIAAYVFGIHIAMTIGKGVVHPEIVDTYVVLSGLAGSDPVEPQRHGISGLPTSSSHALIGGLAGAAIVKGGIGAVVMSGMLKIVSFIVLSPVIGFVLGYVLGTLLTVLLRNARPARNRHVLSAKASFFPRHCTAWDTARTMRRRRWGSLRCCSFRASGKDQSFTDIPFWIVSICNTVMGLGTLLGGWRIVKTMGTKITKLNPFGGFCAETGAAATLFATALAGIPVSTTHTIAGSIVGFGTMRRSSSVHWRVALKIIWAWVLTIPVAGTVGAVTYCVVDWLSIRLY